MKDINTLVDDINGLFENGHEVNKDNCARLGTQLTETISRRLVEAGQRNTAVGSLRMSNLGKPDRQLWYDLHSDYTGEAFTASTLVKFLFGDILELLLLFLAREAGHTVESEQAEVELDGIVGHIDAVIDGTVVDAKSASTYGFKKFKDGTILEDDPFGYVEQLAGYATAMGGRPAGWLAIDKTLGHITYRELPQEYIESAGIAERITHIRQVLSNPETPDRCYSDNESGKSGNRELGVNCSYCSHKFHCWSDANGGLGLRTFLYSGGPKHLTQVEREPNVVEITF